MFNIQEQIRYFSNLEKTYNEQLEKSDNEHFNSLTTISRDMFKAGKEALEKKFERDKMRCENCKWLEKESSFADDEVAMSEQICFSCSNMSGLAFLKLDHFCSHFEQKENTHNDKI